MKKRLSTKKRKLSKIMKILKIWYRETYKNLKRIQMTAKFQKQVFEMTRKDANLFVWKQTPSA